VANPSKDEYREAILQIFTPEELAERARTLIDKKSPAEIDAYRDGTYAIDNFPTGVDEEAVGRIHSYSNDMEKQTFYDDPETVNYVNSYLSEFIHRQGLSTEEVGTYEGYNPKIKEPDGINPDYQQAFFAFLEDNYPVAFGYMYQAIEDLDYNENLAYESMLKAYNEIIRGEVKATLIPDVETSVSSRHREGVFEYQDGKYTLELDAVSSDAQEQLCRIQLDIFEYQEEDLHAANALLRQRSGEGALYTIADNLTLTVYLDGTADEVMEQLRDKGLISNQVYMAYGPEETIGPAQGKTDEPLRDAELADISSHPSPFSFN
jgi:hypothetical protein